MMVKDRHYDSMHIRGEIDNLQKKWSSFYTSVGDYRDSLDTSVQFFTLMEEEENWVKEGSQLLINVGRKATECRGPNDASELIIKLESYVKDGQATSDARLTKLSEYSIQLYGKCCTLRNQQIKIVKCRVSISYIRYLLPL